MHEVDIPSLNSVIYEGDSKNLDLSSLDPTTIIVDKMKRLNTNHGIHRYRKVGQPILKKAEPIISFNIEPKNINTYSLERS